MSIIVTIPLSRLYQKFGVKTAISLPDLVRQTNAFSKKYRPGCTPSLLDSNPKALFLHYNVKCNKEDSDPGGHDVRVQFDVTKVQESSQAKDLDIQVSCSCVAPGTMVRMADGTEKPIEQVQVGDWVITHKGRARRVTAITTRPAKDGEQAWEVKAEGYRNPLVLSDDHPLGVVRGHELCACGCGEPLYPRHYRNVTIRQRWARKFVKGHYRRGETNPDRFSDGVFRWKTSFELVERERLYFPKIAWVGTEQVDLNFASLVGYYLAEGHVPAYLKKAGRWGNEIVCVKSAIVSIGGSEHRVYGVVFTLNQNERHTLALDIEAKAKLVCGKEAEIVIQDHQHKDRKWLTVTVKDKNFAAAMVRAVGRGSLTKKLSDWVLGWSPEAMMSLVSSYALGDGYVGDDSQCVFSISRDLISQISMFLFSIGVWHSWTYHRKRGTKNTSYRLNWNYREYPQLLEAMTGRMREEDRARAEMRLGKEACWGDCRDREWGAGFIRSLRSKKRVGTPSIFHDLTVEEDESFIANGVVVHNCPAFLYWGAQWNLHQRDGLLGTPRPQLQAPTERLDLRGNFVICKHCISPDAKVLMADGTEKPIDDVEVGDWVITHKGRNRRVIATSRRPAKPGELAVETLAKGCSEPLTTSEDHQFATVRGNEACFCGCKGVLPYNYRGALWERKYLLGHHQNRPPRKLSKEAYETIRSSFENQYALAAAYGVSQGTISRVRSWVEPQDDPGIEDCSKGKLRWVSPKTGLTAHDYLYFPKVAWAGTEEADSNLASLLGYYLAEGSVVKAESGKKYRWKAKKSMVCRLGDKDYNIYGVQFTLNVNERLTLAHDIAEKIKALLGQHTEVVTKRRKFKNKKWLTVTVNHPAFALNMLRLGGCGSKNKRLSPEAWNWSFSRIRDVLASYALGDGHFDKFGQQYVYSISRPLISQISTILFAAGVWHGHLYQDWQGQKGRGAKKKNRYHRLYWDYRQYPQVLESMKGRLRPHVLRRVASVSPSGESADRWEDGFVRCLRSIKQVSSPSYFCDISVDEDESFIANRIVVHNCHAVFERILPSVQHNIVKILRERVVQENKDEFDKSPERLQEKQEEMKKKKELEKIRKVKDKEVQDKLFEALREQEEARLMHEEELEDQAEPVVHRDHPATEPAKEEPKPKPAPAPAPAAPAAPKPAPKGEEEAIQNLYQNEQKSIEQKHRKGEPHVHKGLPYEETEAKPVKEKKSPEYMEKLRKVWKYVKDRAKELALSEEGK